MSSEQTTNADVRALVEFFGTPTNRPPRVPCLLTDGSLDLCYRSPSEKARLHRACEVKVFDNCRSGARRTCSIAALRAAKRRAFLARVTDTFFSVLKLGYRSDDSKSAGKGGNSAEAATEQVMAACVARADDRCRLYSTSFCDDAFQ